jgi:mannose-6-phosphate isomerase-like protein (cupin superfamily)
MNLRSVQALAPALLLLLSAPLAQPSLAQAQPAQTPFTSAAEVEALMAKAERDRKPDQPNFIQPLLKLAPYTANLEYRTARAPAAVHAKEAELFYVLEGSGTLVTGGTLTDASQRNPDNMTGSGIADGQTRKVAKGDVFVVPENTPHWFSAVDGRLVLMSLHLPRGAQPGG